MPGSLNHSLSSESDSDSESGPSLLSSKLQVLHNELTNLTAKTYRIYKTAKEIRKSNLYKHPFPLKAKAAKYFHADCLSTEQILQTWIPIWKQENRLGVSGKTVVLNEKEASLLHLPHGEQVCVYTVCKQLVGLFE
jgi:hypothetical protein